MNKDENLNENKLTRSLSISNREYEKLYSNFPIKNDQDDKKRCDDLFKQFDKNGNGFLSLAELDSGINDMGPPMLPVFKSKKAMLMAYNKAKSFFKDGNNDYV